VSKRFPDSAKRHLRSDSRPTLVGNGSLPPRLRRTLEELLAGGSEKNVAERMGVTPHTLHGYVKELYRHFGVRSRVDLMVRIVGRDQKRWFS
jgi:DNA-binding NarL/FixJ family response regulator